MKPVKEGYRVAVVGASSLLGKELVAILEQGKFPVSRLLTFESDEDEPELPIIDLNSDFLGYCRRRPNQRGGAGLRFHLLAPCDSCRLS